MNTIDATLHELITVVLARDLRDEEVGFTGLATGGNAARFAASIPIAAMELARRIHAPGLTTLFSGWIQNPDLQQFSALPDTQFQSSFLDIRCEGNVIEYPGQFALRRGDIDFGFCSAAQVDREGNVNSVCIGDPERPKVRLIGPVLIPEHMAVFGREYIMMPYHEKRNFVERVDYVAGVGYPAGRTGRKRLGLDWGGPALIITPKCIFGFDDEGVIYVASIHPGVTHEDLRASTGFELGSLDEVPETAMPTEHELHVLRTFVDPQKILLA